MNHLSEQQAILALYNATRAGVVAFMESKLPATSTTAKWLYEKTEGDGRSTNVAVLSALFADVVKMEIVLKYCCKAEAFVRKDIVSDVVALGLSANLVRLTLMTHPLTFC